MYHIVDLNQEANSPVAYENHPVAEVNDHVVRISIMTGAFPWHHHPNSDEGFWVLEGELMIEFEGEIVRLAPGKLLTIPKGIRHRTRPMGERSVNLTFERADAATGTALSLVSWALSSAH